MRTVDDSKVVISKGQPEVRERWPFSKLKVGQFFQVDDVKHWIAVRTAASRAGTRLSKKFSVRKALLKGGKEVIRVYIAT